MAFRVGACRDLQSSRGVFFLFWQFSFIRSSFLKKRVKFFKQTWPAAFWWRLLPQTSPSPCSFCHWGPGWDAVTPSGVTSLGTPQPGSISSQPRNSPGCSQKSYIFHLLSALIPVLMSQTALREGDVPISLISSPSLECFMLKLGHSH